MPTGPEYVMRLDLNVLNHLGINLYSNVPAILSEAVANSWDADAEHVWIEIDREASLITITDDGAGMTRDEVNKKYLNVGYERRKQEGGAVTPQRGRLVMGRKGIGKLSLFSIADEIEVQTVKAGEKSRFLMSLARIREQIGQGRGTYAPESLDPSGVEIETGTRIRLTGLKRRLTQAEPALRRRLARRFSIIGSEHDFSVLINDRPVTVEDRGYFSKVEYMWLFGEESDRHARYCANLKKFFTRGADLPGSAHAVSGWIGTVEHSGDLQDEGESINKIVLMVRGKLAQEDILEEFGEGGVYTKYLIGEVHADFLDLDGAEDITTTSRQKVIEDDPRYQQLRAFLRQELKNIQNFWTTLRNDAGTAKALAHPAIQEWFKTLGPDQQRRARTLFGKINQLTIESEGDRRQLFKHAVLAFESLRYKENLDALELVRPEDIQALTEVFLNLDDIEATWYHQIVKERLEVIRALQDKVDQNAREKVIQRHLFDHLWLLDPSWERATTTPFMEQQVSKEFADIEAGLSAEEKAGRLDIKYKKTSGEHVIVELKRAERPVSTFQLLPQIDKYRSGLAKILGAAGRHNEPVEFVCVLGKPPTDWGSPDGQRQSVALLKDMNARIVMYDELIEGAYRSYQQYLEKDEERGRIAGLIQSIDEGGWGSSNGSAPHAAVAPPEGRGDGAHEPTALGGGGGEFRPGVS